MRTSQSLYRVLLRMCPPDLRADFGAEMEALFLADLGAGARLSGKLRVWARAIADVLRHGLGARQRRVAPGPKDVGVRRVRHRRMVDGYASIRPSARDSGDGAASRHRA